MISTMLIAGCTSTSGPAPAAFELAVPVGGSASYTSTETLPYVEWVVKVVEIIPDQRLQAQFYNGNKLEWTVDVVRSISDCSPETPSVTGVCWNNGDSLIIRSANGKILH